MINSQRKGSRSLGVLILAAGQGTRMKSALPKVLHAACGKPLIAWAVEAARAALSEALGLRERVQDEEGALWRRTHELAWRIAAQRLLEAELVRLEVLAADLRGQKAWWQGYLGHLQGGPAPQPNPQPGPQPGPNPPQPGQPYAQLWVWVAVLAGLGALASALWHWLRRRRLSPAV